MKGKLCLGVKTRTYAETSSDLDGKQYEDALRSFGNPVTQHDCFILYVNIYFMLQHGIVTTSAPRNAPACQL